MITNNMIHRVYELGIKVDKTIISRMEACNEVAMQCGMDNGSEKDYITVLLAMLRGEEYHRTINSYATEYYLESIGKDYGRIAQQKAAMAALQHTQYYATLGKGNLVSIEKIAKRYL